MCPSLNQLPRTRGWDALIVQDLVTCTLLKPEMVGCQLHPITRTYTAWVRAAPQRKWSIVIRSREMGEWPANQLMVIVHGTRGVLSGHSVNFSHLVFCFWMLSTRFSSPCKWLVSHRLPQFSSSCPYPCFSPAGNTLCGSGRLADSGSLVQMSCTLESLLKLAPAWISLRVHYLSLSWFLPWDA